MSLEQLAVVSAPQITFDPKYPDRITVEFTPTVPHCGMSTFIGKYRDDRPHPTRSRLCFIFITGLSIRVRLLRSLPQRFKVDIKVKPGSHQSEHARTPSGLAELPRPCAHVSHLCSKQTAERQGTCSRRARESRPSRGARAMPLDGGRGGA